jgi:hypothetical protein
MIKEDWKNWYNIIEKKIMILAWSGDTNLIQSKQSWHPQIFQQAQNNFVSSHNFILKMFLAFSSALIRQNQLKAGKTGSI